MKVNNFVTIDISKEVYLIRQQHLVIKGRRVKTFDFIQYSNYDFGFLQERWQNTLTSFLAIILVLFIYYIARRKFHGDFLDKHE